MKHFYNINCWAKELSGFIIALLLLFLAACNINKPNSKNKNTTRIYYPEDGNLFLFEYELYYPEAIDLLKSNYNIKNITDAYIEKDKGIVLISTELGLQFSAIMLEQNRWRVCTNGIAYIDHRGGAVLSKYYMQISIPDEYHIQTKLIDINNPDSFYIKSITIDYINRKAIHHNNVTIPTM